MRSVIIVFLALTVCSCNCENMSHRPTYVISQSHATEQEYTPTELEAEE